jgi:hypothetical protein
MSGALQAVFQNQRSFAPPNFITTQKGSGTTNSYGPRQFSIDPTGNSYNVLAYQGAGLTTGGGNVSKITPTGTTAWQVSSTSASYNCGCGENPPYLSCGIVDASGNFYLATQVLNGSGQGGWQIAKFNSSGTIQWQRRLQGSSANGNPIKVGVDSSGNVYVLGVSSSLILVKYNSSGTRQWQKVINNWFASVAGMYVDPSGNIYLCGSDAGPPAAVYGMIALKLDTSGTVLSYSPIYRASNGATTQVLGTSISVDSAGNIYISGQQLISGVYSTLVLKLDSSFALQWGRYITGGGVSTPSGANQLSFDSSDNVYVAAGNLTKFNSSGTTQLQRRFLETTNIVENVLGVQNYQTNMYVATKTGTANGYGGVTYVLPNDGSKTGVYTVGTSTLTYEASTQTITTYVSNTSTGRADVQNASTATWVDSAGTGTINTITTTNVTATI